MDSFPKSITHALAAAALAVMAVLATAGAASASKTQPTMLQDDAVLLGGTQDQRNQRLDELKALGVDIVKVRVNWRAIAPNNTDRTKPSGFDGSNPDAYPASNWAPYDDIVRGAAARSMQVYFELGGSAPEWATGGKKDSAIYEPSPSEFQAFVTAVGKRYSGTSGGSGGGGAGGGVLPPLPQLGIQGATAAQSSGALPRVSIYSVWNEPNLASWLAPQYKKKVPYAPVMYRRLLYAAADGLQASGHGSDQLLWGELLPFARTGRTGSTKSRPIAFMREVACLDPHYRPYKGKAAKLRGCTGKFRALPGTGLAFHPYTLAGGPDVKTPNKDDASIGTLSRVTHALDRIAARKRGGRRLPLWITEFGFQSNPPDQFATKLSRIPGFMGKSEWIAFKNRRVASYSQYPLLDDADLGGFQSGLRFKDGSEKKSVYAAFQHAFWARKVSGSRVELFGCERAASSGNVTVEARTGKKWKAVGTIPVNGLGYFDKTLKLSGAANRQYRYRFGSSVSRAAKAE